MAFDAGNMLVGGGLAAFLAGMMMFAFFLFVVLYVYFALVLQTIAKKTKTENPWWAWIPILNLILMVKIAKLHWAWVLIFFAGIIPVIGALAALAGSIYIWWKICEERKKPGWWSILLLIPLVNFVIAGLIAWQD